MNSIENNNNIDKNLYLYLYSTRLLKCSDDNVRPLKNHTAWGDGVLGTNHCGLEPLKIRVVIFTTQTTTNN